MLRNDAVVAVYRRTAWSVMEHVLWMSASYHQKSNHPSEATLLSRQNRAAATWRQVRHNHDKTRCKVYSQAWGQRIDINHREYGAVWPNSFKTHNQTFLPICQEPIPVSIFIRAAVCLVMLQLKKKKVHKSAFINSPVLHFFPPHLHGSSRSQMEEQQSIDIRARAMKAARWVK